ncbi:MAG: ATP-binding protein [Pseudobdellovibrio sp.]
MIILISICSTIFNKINFKTIDLLIRDCLQYFNYNRKIDNSIVTFNIDIYSDGITHPLQLNDIKKVIDKLSDYNPKNIVLLLEPADLIADPNEKKGIFNYLSQKKVYINRYEVGNNPGSISFSDDSVFSNYPYFFEATMCRDSDWPSTRRMIIEYNLKGPDSIDMSLKKLGLNPKNIDSYEYYYDFWNTKQIYAKTSPLGTFGNFQSSDLLANRILPDAIANKVILVGHHDEFSFLVSPNIFNLLGNSSKSSIRDYFIPFQDVVANNINTRLTGDYIKFLANFPVQALLLIILILLTISHVNDLTKLYIFLSLVPSILIIQILIYIFGSFYINFSSSVAMLIFLQYLGLPLFMLLIFKRQEEQKFKAVNDARIDALLSVSEKVAHDIRSPLSAINLIISKANFQSSEHKDILMQSIRRIDDIAESILQKYKIKPNKDSGNYSKLNLQELTQKIVNEKMVIDPTIVYVININSGEDVFGYDVELTRVISNILDNSIHALQNKVQRKIEITTNTQNGMTDLVISDNGIGIPTSILSLIGSHQITTKQNLKGNGIGLLHAKRVIENMGGNFSIESVENEYTKVTISLRNKA